MAEVWWQRPAIVWRNHASNEANSTNCQEDGYWQVPSNDVALSYHTMFHWATVLALKLRVEMIQSVINSNDDISFSAISGCDNDNKQRRLRSVPVAVAIPEGPFLPIAIAAVHALNIPFSTHENNASIMPTTTTVSAVLLPLEPTDGRERLQRMLQDARPVLILTASDCDLERMHTLITAQEYTTCSDGASLFCKMPGKIQVIDIRQLLREALAEENSRPVDSAKIMKVLKRANKMTTLLDIFNACLYTLDAESLGSCHHRTQQLEYRNRHRISHIVFTSGTTGRPKGCVASIQALQHYIFAKNQSHGISDNSIVLLASALSFDPCLSDILATFTARATLAIAPRNDLLQSLGHTLRILSVSHILCTPTLWSTIGRNGRDVNAAFPRLEIVALGGERIPRQIVRSWARSDRMDNCSTSLRLCATFGVTEACVYQTFGEVFRDSDETPGQDVGTPLTGLNVRICRESSRDCLVDVTKTGHPDGVGEVVLFGKQLDKLSCYLNQPELSSAKFILENGTYYYRTGDRGYIHKDTLHLHIMGRIAGEDGMVKFNGVRVELGEIEAALVDDGGDQPVIVVDSMVVAETNDEGSSNETSTATDLRAYVVLSSNCGRELGLSLDVPASGVLCTECPLLALLRERCRTRARVVPSVFTLIPRIPLSSTGKRSRRGVPSIEEAVPLSSFLNLRTSAASLREYGGSGSVVAREIVDCLNLQPCQEALLTTTATFAMLGGDSLAATRVVRALYAYHHNVNNTRYLGGEYGALEGPFAVVHLLLAGNLGRYVDWLDSHGVCRSRTLTTTTKTTEGRDTTTKEYSRDNQTGNTVAPSLVSADRRETEAAQLYDALLKTTTNQSPMIAVALLEIGVDPNFGEHGGRLGKTSGRIQRKKIFRSSPLHLACLKGIPYLVEKLLEKKAKFNSPNPSGLFPLHLAASGEFHQSYSVDDDSRRKECVRLLLEAGAPLFMKDGSKQTIVHAAARAGNCKVLRFVLERWMHQISLDPRKQGSLDWRDNWSRTPVHWAVLNGKADALAILLDWGCSANPPKPKDSQQKKRSSAATESPMEICSRVHGTSDVGQKIAALLHNSIKS